MRPYDFYHALMQNHWVRRPQNMCAKPQGMWEECTSFTQGWCFFGNAQRSLPFETAQQDRVHRFLIPWINAFIDQGIAHVAMPYREKGFFKAVCQNMALNMPVRTQWLKVFQKLCREVHQHNTSPEQMSVHMLQEMGVSEADWESYVEHLLLPLKGWAGMVWRLERFPEEWGAHPYPACLMDVVCVLLMLRRAVHGFEDDGVHADEVQQEKTSLDGAYGLWQCVQWLGVSRVSLKTWGVSATHAFLDETVRFLKHDVYALFQDAYEQTYTNTCVASLQQNKKAQSLVPKPSPTLQYVFCIDDREECLRRYIEEQDPSYETFGTAGFFGLPIAFTSVDQTMPVALCPMVMKPSHRVVEDFISVSEVWKKVRKRQRQYWGRMLHEGRTGSRSLTRGWLWSVLGVFTFPAAFLRVFNPFVWSLCRFYILQKWFPKPHTRLTALEGVSHTHSDVSGPFAQLPVGMNMEQAAQKLKHVLQEIGLCEHAQFGTLVAMVGHASTTSNNPYSAAYGCGACSGGDGGTNARLFASMANHPEVRQALKKEGVHIPDHTWFVGAEHDTCSSEIRFSDVYAVPSLHQQAWLRMKAVAEKATALSAQERCRRFMSAPLGLSPAQAMRHVQARAHDLAQPRPEYGHAGHACVVVGQRHATRGLFLDRRAFLASYDHAIDPEGTVLERILSAVVPVCTGINLGYYFSYTDPQNHGSGSKLAHNVAGLVGVMDGHQSDLRTGLAWQMVEIHEPMRLLLMVETTQEVLHKVLQRKPHMARLAERGWYRLGLIHPVSGEVFFYGEEGYVKHQAHAEVLKTVTSYQDCWKASRGFMPPKRVEVLK